MARFSFGKGKTTTTDVYSGNGGPKVLQYRQSIDAKKGRTKRPFHEFWPVTGLKRKTLPEGLIRARAASQRSQPFPCLIRGPKSH